MTNPFHPFTPPFRYSDEHAQIIDANGIHVLAMSGWDERRKCYLTLKAQDTTGELVAQLMNNHAMQEGE